MGAVKKEWRTHRHPKAVVAMSATIPMGKKKLDTKAVAVAVGWLLLSMLEKAIDAELRAKAKARWSQ